MSIVQFSVFAAVLSRLHAIYMARSVKCSPHVIIRLAENYQALTVAMISRGTIDAGLVPNNIVIAVYLISDLIYEIYREGNRQYIGGKYLKKILKNCKKDSMTHL